jgi:hypothetical protein
MVGGQLVDPATSAKSVGAAITPASLLTIH